MTTLEDVEALAQRLSPAERLTLAKRWLAEQGGKPLPNGGGPGVNGAREREEYTIWDMGTDPVDCGVTDGSVNHDRYFYDPSDD